MRGSSPRMTLRGCAVGKSYVPQAKTDLFNRQIGGLDDLGPFVRLIRRQLAELLRRHRHRLAPRSAMRFLILGSASASLKALFRIATISGGMPFGPATP